MIEGKTIDGQVTDDGKTLVGPAAAQGHDDVHDPPLHDRGAHRPPAAREPDQGAWPTLPRPCSSSSRRRRRPWPWGASRDRGPGQRRLRTGQVRIERRADAPRRGRDRLRGQDLASWTKFAASGAVLSHALELDPAQFKAGPDGLVRAVARDRRQLDLSRAEARARRSRPRPGSRSTSWRPRRRPRPSWRSSRACTRRSRRSSRTSSGPGPRRPGCPG